MTKKHDESDWDRRGFLKCMAWVGTGAVWNMTSAVILTMNQKTIRP